MRTLRVLGSGLLMVTIAGAPGVRAGECDLTCEMPANGEPCGDDLDSMCYNLMPLVPGVEICGLAWASYGTRDTDWYNVPVDDPDGDGLALICSAVTSDFPAVNFIIDGACGQIEVLATGCGGSCDNLSIATAIVAAPAVYTIFVAAGNCDGSGVFEGYECGTFNTYTLCVSVTNALDPCTPCAVPCPGDLNGDGMIGPADLAGLLDAWGPNPGHPSDLNGDGDVGPADLAALLDQWGPC